MGPASPPSSRRLEVAPAPSSRRFELSPPPSSRRLGSGPSSSRQPLSTIPPVEQSLPSARPAFPFRLRYLVLLVGAGLGLRSFGERALAYWQLHATAAPLANYAACMVGPTGPQLLRARPTEFWRLARRRIVESAPEARPFAACVPALRAFAGDGRRAAHEAKAGNFREHAALRGDAKTTLALADLEVSAARLEELRVAAWPFAPANLDELVRPERNAKAAPHPADPPRPGRARGLPAAELGYSSVRISGSSHVLVAGQGANVSAHRSDDGGLTWKEAVVDDPAVWALAGQCSSGDGAVRFKLRESGEQLRVDSWLAGAVETSFPLAGADSRLLGFACDGTAALAITRSEADARLAFRICPERSPCRNLAVPPALRGVPAEAATFSVARIKGVSVVSMARAGVVRVISSRDDGATWTPPVVAYDHEEQGGGTTPTHLLSLGSKLMLYAGGRGPSEVYPSLWSSDFGASWQGPS